MNEQGKATPEHVEICHIPDRHKYAIHPFKRSRRRGKTPVGKCCFDHAEGDRTGGHQEPISGDRRARRVSTEHWLLFRVIQRDPDSEGSKSCHDVSLEKPYGFGGLFLFVILNEEKGTEKTGCRLALFTKHRSNTTPVIHSIVVVVEEPPSDVDAQIFTVPKPTVSAVTSIRYGVTFGCQRCTGVGCDVGVWIESTIGSDRGNGMSRDATLAGTGSLEESAASLRMGVGSSARGGVGAAVVRLDPAGFFDTADSSSAEGY